ncbi:ABC transporter ATP-binding protein [Cohnella candidum]|uniref:ABC transporter ATP-binding protein n=1 Tax=Cohnella candidum TaxID=2674991 RepID=A0A3G3K0Q8_9BACL|nr:ABC transporter ATP-binding protein [Cohnella candidum]AYQ73339.1 ABC transporter ATP-binding protein [Cohnella candidum]
MMDKASVFKQYFAYWNNNKYFLSIAYRTAPRRVVLQFVLTIMNYTVNYLHSILFISYVFSAIENNTPYSRILIFISAMLLIVFLLMAVSEWFENRYKPVCDLAISQELNRMLFAKAADVELACYENTEFYNKYTRAAKEADQRMALVLDNLTEFAGALVSFVLLLVTAALLDPVALVFMVIPIATKFMITVRRNRATFELNQANTAPTRVKNYVNRVAYLESYAKELRMSAIFSVLLDRYDRALGVMRANFLGIGRKAAKYRALDDTFGMVAPFPLSILYAAYSALIIHKIKIVSFVVLLNTINNLSRAVANLSTFFTNLQENSLYIDNLREFLQYEPAIAQGQPGLRSDNKKPKLELINVSFAYSADAEPILRNISLTVEPGEKIALVGHNGAGKSTLIKLIMRLYDPTTGAVCVNGNDAREYAVDDYRQLFGTVFQDCKVMAMSLADNLYMRRAADSEHAQAQEVLERVGVYAKIASLGGSTASVLTREFDEAGLVLSGGEIQKISIGRLFTGNSRIAILDEPSSALDPVAEYKTFDLLLRAAEDRSVLFISHRLSSALLADRIYLLEHGRIVECGSHQELMALNGKYAEMFHKQAESYQEEERTIV